MTHILSIILMILIIEDTDEGIDIVIQVFHIHC